MAEWRHRPLRWKEKHEINFERAKAAMNTAIGTNHSNVDEKVFLCLYRSDEVSIIKISK